MLQVEAITTNYGRIRAVSDLSLSVAEGEIVTLIGSNGAGKSTTLMTISGVLRPSSGRILFQGEPIQGLPPHKIVERGVVQVPEGRRVLPELTVRENLDLGAFRRSQRDREQMTERVFGLFPRLEERAGQFGGTLSGGEQQMLAIGRALMAEPRILLLDEPSLGLAPTIVDQIFDIIAELNRTGTTLLLVEQNAVRALEIAHRGYVLETGRLVAQGRASELEADPAVRKAYLGIG